MEGTSMPRVTEEEEEEEALDPRVQEELEKLNSRTEEINQLEMQLEEANALFRTLLSDSTHQVRLNSGIFCSFFVIFMSLIQLKAMSKRLGGCIEKARPYYEAQEAYMKAQQECQSAATHYQVRWL